MSPGPMMAPEQSVATPDRRGLAALRDDQLLARFFWDRDDAAFGVLLERHGPLVYGVCRRILGEATEAEDAFQATFLVLVRKGASLRQPGRLANWLYGVAHRTARKARAKAAFRRKTEREAGEMPTTSDVSDMTFEELKSVLDEEICQLPEKYALPLVLCYLEGKTNAEAAAQLGWPEGSISRRLSRARELLKSRLARRGMALSAALIASVFSRPTVACVPRELMASTAQASSLVAQGAMVEDVVSPATAKLVHEVVLGMSAASRFAVPAALGIVLSLLIIVGVVTWDSVSRAGTFSFGGAGNRAHALMTPVSGSSGMTIAIGDAGAAGGCGAASAATGCGSATP